MTLLSIIVPIHNVEKYLKRSIEALLNQTLRDIEIILVNDGSTDNSLKICEKYAGLDSRIVVINQENGGVSKARNVGISCAQSEYIAFMDPDDEIANNMYELLFEDIKKNEVDIVLCNYKFIKGSKTFDVLLPYKEGKYKEDIVRELLLGMIGPKKFGERAIMGSVWRGIYKKSIILENNILFPLNIRPMQDLIFNLEYLLSVKSIYINNLCLYNYYENPNSALTSYKSNMWINFQEVLDLIIKILNKKNLYEDSIDRLANRCGEEVLSCISNEVKFSNKISLHRKLNNIDSFFDNYIIQDYLKSINTQKSNIRGKILGYLLKKKKIRCLFFMKLFQNYVIIFK